MPRVKIKIKMVEDYFEVQPASTIRRVPVTFFDSSDIRYRTAYA